MTSGKNTVVVMEHRAAKAVVDRVAITLTEFDQRRYLRLINARGKTIRAVIAELKAVLGLATALDAGCGVGFFSQILQECGLHVAAFDGRMENVAEAHKRFPEISFEQGDIENPGILALGKFDLTLCFGLLYHLENPMLAIRHLRALTGKGLLLESMCIPGNSAGMVLREEPAAADQSLTDIALYPSEACLVKMLYRAGFAAVYRVAELPDHDDFRETPLHARRRTVLFAAVEPVRVGGFERIDEPRGVTDPWSKTATNGDGVSLAGRVLGFLRRPQREQYISLAYRARRVFPEMPIPLRLPFGAWWLAQKSALDDDLIHEGFEDAEMAFVEKLLRPGMTVLDAGAHHGLYTLLASKRVGADGRVIAFEPSSRERKRLVRHLRLNRCKNVSVQPYALGDRREEANLFVVAGREDWCNSLRAPQLDAGTSTERVAVERADDVLEKLGIVRVDFIKLDVEGAELSFLLGARRTLMTSRPVILVEVQDVRCRPWGYAAREIVDFLTCANYCWFALTANSNLQPISARLKTYDANLVALPEERADEICTMLTGMKFHEQTEASRQLLHQPGNKLRPSGV
jgi:FkbM family methyltransferase